MMLVCYVVKIVTCVTPRSRDSRFHTHTYRYVYIRRVLCWMPEFNRHTGMVRTEPGNSLGMRQPFVVQLAPIV